MASDGTPGDGGLGPRRAACCSCSVSLRLPPRLRVLKDSWPHSSPCLRLSPWGCVVARLGKGHCDAQAFMP